MTEGTTLSSPHEVEVQPRHSGMNLDPPLVSPHKWEVRTQDIGPIRYLNFGVDQGCTQVGVRDV